MRDHLTLSALLVELASRERVPTGGAAGALTAAFAAGVAAKAAGLSRPA